MTRWIAAAVDIAVVVTFAALGRNTHDESMALVGIAQTAAPFLVGLAIGWFVASQLIGRPTSGYDRCRAGVPPAGSATNPSAAPVQIQLQESLLRGVERPGSWTLSVRTGLVIWPVTVFVGMAIRAATEQGTALPFVVVAVCFLGAGLVGWRLIVGLARRRQKSV